MKIGGLEGIKRNECSITFPSLKLPNNSLLLKLPNRGNKRIFLKYIYILHSIPFFSFPSSQMECYIPVWEREMNGME
jgi:hypothetical protein